MKNPNDIYAVETTKRPTMFRVAQSIGVSYPALWKWFTGKTSPRLVHLQILARHMDTTVDEVLACIARSHALTKAGVKLPYGLMVEKGMLQKEYDALITTQSENA